MYAMLATSQYKSSVCLLHEQRATPSVRLKMYIAHTLPTDHKRLDAIVKEVASLAQKLMSNHMTHFAKYLNSIF